MNKYYNKKFVSFLAIYSITLLAGFSIAPTKMNKCVDRAINEEKIKMVILVKLALTIFSKEGVYTSLQSKMLIVKLRVCKALRPIAYIIYLT